MYLRMIGGAFSWTTFINPNVLKYPTQVMLYCSRIWHLGIEYRFRISRENRHPSITIKNSTLWIFVRHSPTCHIPRLLNIPGSHWCHLRFILISFHSSVHATNEKARPRWQLKHLAFVFSKLTHFACFHKKANKTKWQRQYQMARTSQNSNQRQPHKYINGNQTNTSTKQ